jgi:hypothetical protein
MRNAAASPLIVVVGLLLLASIVRGHKGITSKFTYNGEVHAIFLNRCGRCHVDGGIGPMSLLKYEEAFPWAESLRVELLGAAAADPHDFVRAAHRQISARELDIVLEWATGGTPEGDEAQTPPDTSLRIEWAAGIPDLVAKMPTPYVMSATTHEATHETSMPIGALSIFTVGRVDVLPGNPAIVRSVVLSLRTPDGTTTLLGTWVPRQVPAAVALKPPVRVEPGSHLIARIHYKKHWKNEGQQMTDSSLVGLYFAN